MSYSAQVEAILDDLQHTAAASTAVICGAAGSVKGGTAVQLQAEISDGRLQNIGFWAYGSPTLLAACEHCCRLLASQEGPPMSLPPMAQIADELCISRERLSALLVIEDAWRALCAQVDVKNLDQE